LGAYMYLLKISAWMLCRARDPGPYNSNFDGKVLRNIVYHHRYSLLPKSFPVLARCRSNGLSVRTFFDTGKDCYLLQKWSCCFNWLITCWTLGLWAIVYIERSETNWIYCKWRIESTSFLCFLADVLSTSMMQTEKIYGNDAAPSSSKKKQCTNSHMQTWSLAAIEHLHFICAGLITKRFDPCFMFINNWKFCGANNLLLCDCHVRIH